jgi:hypothetical protein
MQHCDRLIRHVRSGWILTIIPTTRPLDAHLVRRNSVELLNAGTLDPTQDRDVPVWQHFPETPRIQSARDYKAPGLSIRPGERLSPRLEPHAADSSKSRVMPCQQTQCVVTDGRARAKQDH